jgi:predicted nucleic acid-binding protein
MAPRRSVGIDTPFLLAHSLVEHPDHTSANAWREHLLNHQTAVALCPTIFDEFIHVVTDMRRFEKPLSMRQAIDLVHRWQKSRETVLLLPTEESLQLQNDWLIRYRLGRKRIHDTGIAAIYYQNGVNQILTSNARDYSVIEGIETLDQSKPPHE